MFDQSNFLMNFLVKAFFRVLNLDKTLAWNSSLSLLFASSWVNSGTTVL